MQFEWNPEKDALNIRKHGVGFAYAALIFERPTLDKLDDRFEYGEMRTLSIGTVDGIAFLAVSNTDRNGVIRIISARRATGKERKAYDQAIF